MRFTLLSDEVQWLRLIDEIGKKAKKPYFIIKYTWYNKESPREKKGKLYDTWEEGGPTGLIMGFEPKWNKNTTHESLIQKEGWPRLREMEWIPDDDRIKEERGGGPKRIIEQPNQKYKQHMNESLIERDDDGFWLGFVWSTHITYGDGLLIMELDPGRGHG